MLKLKTRIGPGYIVWSTIISAAFVILLIGSLIANSWDAVVGGHITFDTTWDTSKNSYGILPVIYGTLSVTLIAVLIAAPIGIKTAIFISEFLPKKLHLYVKSFLELLAGIPSIIYGLIGVGILNLWIQDLFQLQTGRTILTAGLLLSFMILPTIITLCDNALRQIPNTFRESAQGLGLYPFEVIKQVLLPMARPHMIGAILLAIGRALGETMAVMLIIGSIDKIPKPIFNILTPGQTFTSKLGRELAESSFGSLHFSALVSLGLILLVIVVAISVIGQYFYRNTSVYE